MKKQVLVCGSIAYDHLMSFDGYFKQCFLAESLDNLSVSFQTSSHEISFGGCAPNIAYTLNLLGIVPLILGVAGNDFEKYDKLLKSNKISTKYIEIDPKAKTAAAYILSDKKENQIAIFSQGAMMDFKKGLNVKPINLKNVACAIISPDNPQRMHALAQIFHKNHVPYIFDPGQALTALGGINLSRIVDHAKGIILNEYEASLIEQKLNMKIKKIADKMDFFIETLGANGCMLYENGKATLIPTLHDPNPLDITGCGDSFRAGFLYGYVNGLSNEKSCKFGNAAAAFVLKKKGTQNHKFSIRDLENFVKKLK